MSAEKSVKRRVDCSGTWPVQVTLEASLSVTERQQASAGLGEPSPTRRKQTVLKRRASGSPRTWKAESLMTRYSEVVKMASNMAERHDRCAESSCSASRLAVRPWREPHLPLKYSWKSEGSL